MLFSFFFIVLSFFIIFASSGAKSFRKIKNAISLEFFHFFIIFFLSFLLPVVELMKNDEK